MAGNTFGRILRLTTFGESHGPGIGGVLDGCPAGLPLGEADIQAELDLRKPSLSPTSTSRREADQVKILSGVFESVTTGTPIAFYIENAGQRSGDYDELANVFRPGHADWSYFQKYGGIRDYRGGGRASGRETAARVAGGAIARKILASQQVSVQAASVELGGIAVPEKQIDLGRALSRPYFAAADSVVPLWDKLVNETRAKGDTLGGIVQIVASHVPPGLGEPVFDKLNAVLAHALMSVGAVKGVEFGEGFAAARLTGSQNNDPLVAELDNELDAEGTCGVTHFATNHAGGTLGGISSGQDIVIRVAVKPIASIAQEQSTVTRAGTPARIRIGGRHDISAIPRIVPVLSAMTALALADAILLQKRMS